MYAKVQLWAVVGKNPREQVSFRMDIAAPSALDALYVAGKLQHPKSELLTFTARRRVSQGQNRMVGMGYNDGFDGTFVERS